MEYIFKKDRVEANLGHGTLTISRDEAIGYRPVELLVSSIASCSGAVFRTIFEKQRLPVEAFKISVEISRNESKANRVEKMVLTFEVKGENLNEQKLQRNLEVARNHCSMIQSVEDSIDIEEKLVILND